MHVCASVGTALTSVLASDKAMIDGVFTGSLSSRATVLRVCL
ncbi:hypothetical protein USDA257_c43180 [Sinorhizobium fredii USDA 257]|uniref:Uncharacterized protein n=1 Tax=Sinorhizobium fredii (strain USDA 257) TaxID=1185652 RepID=I3XAF1_SINF2|nr:hypothetical protein USDA257_c43180 [Sinorhizobium fredii USDA 257]